MNNFISLILAAGEGTRMKSQTPKVLHEVCGRPMLAYVLDACRQAGADELIVVVGYRKDEVLAAFADEPGITWVTQTEDRQGTGHALDIQRRVRLRQALPGDLELLVPARLARLEVLLAGPGCVPALDAQGGRPHSRPCPARASQSISRPARPASDP